MCTRRPQWKAHLACSISSCLFVPLQLVSARDFTLITCAVRGYSQAFAEVATPSALTPARTWDLVKAYGRSAGLPIMGYVEFPHL